MVRNNVRTFMQSQPSYTVWCKFLTGKNIDEFDEFLSIHQHFPYQNFPLIIFYRLPSRPLYAQGVIASIHAHAKFFPVQICISVQLNGKTVV